MKPDYQRRFWLASLIILLSGFSAPAQSPGSVKPSEQKMILTGVVYDLNGAVVADGSVVVINKSAGKKYGGATDSEGVYRLELPPALYTIEVGAPGFCAGQVERFRVVNSTHGKMSLDFVLEVAERPERCQHQFILDKRPKRNMKKRPNVVAE
jgi:hypothetical protein